MIHKYLPIKDPSFCDFPEIAGYCPCALEVKDVRLDNGTMFKVGRIITDGGKQIVLYPAGIKLARKVAEVVFS